jgi:hypothetical protein
MEERVKVSLELADVPRVLMRKPPPLTVRVTSFTGQGHVTVRGSDSAGVEVNPRLVRGDSGRKRTRHLRVVSDSDR